MPELPPPTQEKNNGDKEASFTDKVKVIPACNIRLVDNVYHCVK